MSFHVKGIENENWLFILDVNHGCYSKNKEIRIKGDVKL